MKNPKSKLRIIVYGNAALFVALAFYWVFLPVGILAQAIRDPGLSNGQVPHLAFRLHRSLSGRFGPWARARVESARAAQLNTYDISGTEWPIFSAVWYLWSTETLQEAWAADPSPYSAAPAEYAREAVEAAAALVADPNHAAWVRDYWGDDYLHEQDLFYRMLLISGLTSYQKLTGEPAYQDLLRDQVETLSAEIDASPQGLLDDYPGQCYPIDILPAIAAIRRADAVLGTDHSAFAGRALRAFEGNSLDPATGLPAYMADTRTGEGFGSARGVGISFMLVWAPELWPARAVDWYGRFEQQFWQRERWVAGFREFPKGYPLPKLWMDVDSGPVLFGYGTAASAFGIGAARVNGRFDQAYPLSAEALLAAWPLPDGSLLLPGLLSDLSDAPYVGEAALLFSLTRRPLADDLLPPAGSLPWLVYVVPVLFSAIALVAIAAALARTRKWEKILARAEPLKADPQLWLWASLILAGLVAWGLSWKLVSVVLILSAQFLPARKVRIAERAVSR